KRNVFDALRFGRTAAPRGFGHLELSESHDDCSRTPAQHATNFGYCADTRVVTALDCGRVDVFLGENASDLSNHLLLKYSESSRFADEDLRSLSRNSARDA